MSGQLVDLRYAYDNVGNITSYRDYLNSNQLQSFVYDHRDRLTSASTDAVGVGQYSDNYGYNAIGNITSYDGNGYSYSGSHKHAVSVANGVTYSYDANGNPSASLRDPA